MNSKDLLKRYTDGTVPLYDAVAQWMHSNEPCPEWLKYEYESALMNYQSGGDFMEIMGFDLTKRRSTKVKRAAKDNYIKAASNLEYILEDLVELGLKKVLPYVNKPMSGDLLQAVVSYIYNHNKKQLLPYIEKVEEVPLSDEKKLELKDKNFRLRNIDPKKPIQERKIKLKQTFEDQIKFWSANEVAAFILLDHKNKNGAIHISESIVRKL